MVKKGLVIAAVLGAATCLAGYIAYRANVAPKVAVLSSVQVASNDRPYVIKMHAQWCPVCLMTRGVWSQIEKAYATEANLMVFDFTNRETTAATEAEAKRLGLEQLLNEYGGASGIVVVVHGRTKQVLASLDGRRDFAEYREAIDKALEK
jgi:hypothetical protein